MFKNRYFIMGLGLGFILCGVLLIFYGEDLIFSNSTDITIEELKEIGIEKNLYIYTEEELNELIKQSNNEEDEELNVCDNEIEDDIINNESIIFTIPYGLDSYEVTNHLYDIGVLEDKQEFNRILINNNLTKKIIAGDYEYNQNLSVGELIELITKAKILD